MSATMQTVYDISKEVYEGRINNQLSEERITIKRIERTSDNVTDNIGGKYVVFPVRSGRNHGISYRPENTAMAPAGNQKYAAAQENLKHGYQRVRVTGQLMRLARTNTQAFSNAMDEEMDGAKSDIGKDENRIAWGHPIQATTGVTGVLAVLVDNTVTDDEITVDTTQWIEIGMNISIINHSNGATTVSSAYVDAIDSDTGVVTLVDGAGDPVSISASTGNYVTRMGNYNNEPWGLNNIVSNVGALHGINPATAGEEFWNAERDTSTTTLTELAMIAMVDRIRQKGGARISAVFCSLGVRRAYWNIQTGLRRYNEPKEFAGGLVGLSFMTGNRDVPVVEDPDAPAKHMAMVTENELKIFRDKDWYWEDIDGSIWKWIQDYDAFQAFMKQYWQIGTHKRNAHGMFANLTEADG